MTTNTQLADEMARKCSVNLVCPPSGTELATSAMEVWVAKTMLESIPLLELLEVARAARSYDLLRGMNQRIKLSSALANLQKKVEL